MAKSTGSSDLAGLVTPYLAILLPFVEGSMSAGAFAQAFLPQYLDDESARSQQAFDVFDRFFSDVDEYVDDPRLRERVAGTGPDELRQSARRLLVRAGLDTELSATG